MKKETRFKNSFSKLVLKKEKITPLTDGAESIRGGMTPATITVTVITVPTGTWKPDPNTGGGHDPQGPGASARGRSCATCPQTRGCR